MNARTSPEKTNGRRSAGRGATSRADSALFVNSLQKGFAVLKAFSREQPRLTLAQITRLTGLDKSAAQRFLYTLHELGLLKKDEETKHYSLSPRLLEFGYAYLYSDPLIERSQPFLVDAHEKTAETVNLAMLDGKDIITVIRLPSRHVVSLNVQIGIRLPAIYSAAGQAILSRLPADERRRIVAGSDFRQHTPRTILDPREMNQVIDKVAADGYSVVHAQYFQNDISIGAPVIDGAGKVVGAVTVAAPDTRITMPQARKVFIPAVLETARKISVAMGAF